MLAALALTTSTTFEMYMSSALASSISGTPRWEASGFTMTWVGQYYILMRHRWFYEIRIPNYPCLQRQHKRITFTTGLLFFIRPPVSPVSGTEATLWGQRAAWMKVACSIA